MKLLQNVFLAIFLCIGMCATAQIPGYMGKRFLIDAEIQAIPALLTPTSAGKHLWNTNNDNGSYALHSRYGLGIGYVLSRHQMVQAHVNYLQTGMNVQMFTPLAGGGHEEHDLLNVLSGLTFDLAYSRTKPNRGHLAPLGKQKAYHIYMTMVNGNKKLYENGQLIDNQLFGSIDAKYNVFGIGYSVTYNKVIHDQFLLTYGWRINLSSPQLLLRTDLGAGTPDVLDYKVSNLEAFQSGVINKFLAYDMVQFKIGFGLLR